MVALRTSSRGARAALLVAGLLLGVASAGQAQWPQWRGPLRDGSVEDRPGARDWPAQAVLLWERDVGDGYSGPVVAGDRVFVHARRSGQEVVSGLSLASGDELWTARYDAPFTQDPSGVAHGRGPYATPSFADGRLFTLGVTGVLSAWEAEAGTLLWRNDYSTGFDRPFMEFGAAASPLVWGGLCFVHFGGPDEGTPRSPRRGGMVALRVADGSEAWRWSGDRPPGGSSPVIQVIGGQPHLVFKTRQLVVGVDPRTGRQLWRVSYRVEQDNTIVTPLLLGDVLVTSDYEKGVHAWRLERKGETWTARKIWGHREASMFTSSPVVAATQVVGFSHFKRGQLFGLDPGDGRMLWRGEARWGEHASLIARGSQVLVYREDGSLVIGEVTRDRFQSLRVHRLGSGLTWGHPAVVDDRIVVRDGTRLAAYRIGPLP